MKQYKVNYKMNRGEMAGKTLCVTIDGTDIEDVKRRFDRTSDVIAGGDTKYKAEIITVSEKGAD